MVATQALWMCKTAPAAPPGRSAPGTLATAGAELEPQQQGTLRRGADRWVGPAAAAAPLSRPALTAHRSAAAAATSAFAPARSRLRRRRTSMGMPGAQAVAVYPLRPAAGPKVTHRRPHLNAPDGPASLQGLPAPVADATGCSSVEGEHRRLAQRQPGAHRAAMSCASAAWRWPCRCSRSASAAPACTAPSQRICASAEALQVQPP